MTTKSKHTPGPWKISEAMHGISNCSVYGVETTTGIPVANCGVKTNKEFGANASLIAASPDMRKALESILQIEALRTKASNAQNVGALTELLRDIAGTARTALAKAA